MSKKNSLHEVLSKELENQQDGFAITHRDPLDDGISSVQLVRVSGSDIDVVNAARVSYGRISEKLTERDKRLIQFLVNHQHTSPFEHNQLSFRIVAPLFVARQWMRHRMNSYNEMSYRYVVAPVEFYIPKKWRKPSKQNKQASCDPFEDPELTAAYTKQVEAAFAAYEDLLNQGIARELARGLLPMCTYTQFIFTCNLHSLMHFLRLRLQKDAQYEIRCYARSLYEMAYPYFSASLDAWGKLHNVFDKCDNNGHT